MGPVVDSTNTLFGLRIKFLVWFWFTYYINNNTKGIMRWLFNDKNSDDRIQVQVMSVIQMSNLGKIIKSVSVPKNTIICNSSYIHMFINIMSMPENYYYIL